MRKIIFLLLFPFFIICQENKQYDRVLSFSDFDHELKKSINSGENYVLENCKIEYIPSVDSIYLDSIFIKGTYSNFYGNGYGLCINGDLITKEASEFPTIELLNCDFVTLKGNLAYTMPVVLRNLHLNNFNFIYNKEYIELSDGGERPLMFLDSIYANKIKIQFAENTRDVVLGLSNSEVAFNIKVEGQWNDQMSSRFMGTNSIEFSSNFCMFLNNDINTISISNINGVDISRNQFCYARLSGYLGYVNLFENQLDANDCLGKRVVKQVSENEFKIDNWNSLIVQAKIARFQSDGNKFTNVTKYLDTDTLINIIEKNAITPYMLSSEFEFNTHPTQEDDDFSLGQADRNRKLSPKQIRILKKYYQENDSLKITYSRRASYLIDRSEIQYCSSMNDTVSGHFSFRSNIVDNLTLQNLVVDSIFLYSNSFSDYTKIKLDQSILKLGFSYKNKFYSGFEYYDEIKNELQTEEYKNKLKELVSQYRQIINVFHLKGYSEKNLAVFQLKDLEMTQKSYDYYTDPTLNNWFNWKGNQFLKIYSDYGQNPFKALSFCFWTMLYFASFYFFFYSDWDKIDRGFLMQKFNSVMDYFTSEKRIEDFYADEHEREITSFKEFRDTLNENKIYMPSMLVSLAKPIYQISFLRYSLLKFLYRKAEFMAGRKWKDLDLKEHYFIGTLTFFLVLSYIIYLVFIRALNSIVLSINAFSTLGFGQIPVRGFTKYVAIIEGFIGWFLLSVFIVSLLNQMMSV